MQKKHLKNIFFEVDNDFILLFEKGNFIKLSKKSLKELLHQINSIKIVDFSLILSKFDNIAGIQIYSDGIVRINFKIRNNLNEKCMIIYDREKCIILRIICNKCLTY